jgi:hypothetical protein
MSVAAELSPLLATANADSVPLYAGLNGFPAAPMKPAGLLTSATLTAAAATAAGTAEQVLATYSLPAGTLDAVGRTIRIRAFFVTAANTNGKTCKLYFGSKSISTGSVTTSAAAPYLELVVTKSGSSTQIIGGIGYGGTTGIVPVALTGAGTATETDTAAIVIKASGTDGTDSAGDITLCSFTVEYMN